jgi:DNA-binding beta-propeller fold protein YncE
MLMYLYSPRLGALAFPRIYCAFKRIARRLASTAVALGGFGFALMTPAAAQSFVAEWSEDDIGRLGPTGLAVTTAGGTDLLFASDQINGRVITFDLTTGKRIAVWGGVGFGDGEFNSPYGIAVDPASGDLYIADRTNQRIQRITRTGTFVMKWGGLGAGPGEFNGPVGIAADANGNVYVTDHGNHRVQKFRVSNTGGVWEARHLATWGGPGSGEGQFNGPFGITLDATGHLWVADGYNHRLQRFDADGRFLGSVGSFGTGPGSFVTPIWVTFEATGAYYVTETNSDPSDAAAPDLAQQRIQKFDAAGRFLLQWGTLGEAGGQFRLPLQLALDTKGNAYVSDYYNTRLQKFSLATPPPVTPPPVTPPVAGAAARFINVSSRLATRDGDGSRAFIAGFVISGVAPKPVLVRAVGPGLTQFGVNGTLVNPRVRVFSGDQLVADNEDWIDGAALRETSAKVGAFALPAGSRDAALLLTLAPGAYSAHVVANGGEGVALIEVYDAESTQPATQVVNLSTRGFVGTGEDVLVAGFVVSGTRPKRVLVRGVGPTLDAFGVTGALADAVLTLYQGTTAIAENDNWETPSTVTVAAATSAEVAAAATSAGAFALPAGSKDAALVVMLPPGAYSAIVSGAHSGTGAGLVEVYELPPN